MIWLMYFKNILFENILKSKQHGFELYYHSYKYFPKVVNCVSHKFRYYSQWNFIDNIYSCFHIYVLWISNYHIYGLRFRYEFHIKQYVCFDKIKYCFIQFYRLLRDVIGSVSMFTKINIWIRFFSCVDKDIMINKIYCNYKWNVTRITYRL